MTPDLNTAQMPGVQMSHCTGWQASTLRPSDDGDTPLDDSSAPILGERQAVVTKPEHAHALEHSCATCQGLVAMPLYRLNEPAHDRQAGRLRRL